MKAIAVVPGSAQSVHRLELPRPSLDEVDSGRGVRVGMIRAGLCGTDRDLADGRYGRSPDGDDYLIIGHESLGRVAEVGAAAADIVRPGQLVVGTIRRPGGSPHDRIGLPDLGTDRIFIERGISRRHGFMAEEIVDDADYFVPVPDELEGVAILTEPLSCVTKSLRQANEIQARLRLWEPKRALVTGAGTIGLLATLVLRLRGLEVTIFSRRAAPYRNSELLEQIGACYVSAANGSLADTTGRFGPFDIVFESSGAPQLLEPAVEALAPNGILALFSVTPGSHSLQVDVARLNQAMVLGNRVMVGSAAAARDDYVQAIATLGQAEAGPDTRGWLGQLLTTPIEGLDAAAVEHHLRDGRDAIKATVEISRPSSSLGVA